jgi:DNA-binding CsgD family transcriptional regulator
MGAHLSVKQECDMLVAFWVGTETDAEIAARLQISQKTVWWRRHAGMAWLKARIQHREKFQQSRRPT